MGTRSFSASVFSLKLPQSFVQAFNQEEQKHNKHYKHI